ncbi:MAG TPA: HAD family phosphatase [Steroidobacteraceae bacterium]
MTLKVAPESGAGLAANIDAVVFDLGGVLIDWNPRHLYRKLFGDDVNGMERFLAEVLTPAWNERQDAGRSWDAAIAEATASHPQDADLIKAYRERWEEMLGGTLTDSVNILDELRGAGLRLYALTNWSQYTFPYALARYPFLQWFEDIVVSGREGVVKPHPAIFRLLLSRSGIEASRSVFIDDALKNVEAAGLLGFRTIHFRNALQLRQDLAGLGLMTERPIEIHT